MKKIKRDLERSILNKLKSYSKAILIYGARQVGKTTLVNDILKKFPKSKILSISGDEKKYHDILSSQDKQKLEGLVAGYDIFFLDEAQKIENIGVNLKILIDNFPNLKILATGSSSFDLKNQIQEPLTGRVWTYSLFPISYSELGNFLNNFELQDTMQDRMIFGSYPNIFSLKNYEDRKEYLRELSTAYLYKDIFEITNIKYPEKIRKLLKLLAWQISKEFSLSELSNKLETSKETVANYIDLLEKSFVIFRLSGFSRNLRKEITKKDKIYFWDLGVRNALLNHFSFLKNRFDVGDLWENFLISERIKNNNYKKNGAISYFWRLQSGAEIDYVEERDGKIFGYEIKTGNKVVRTPVSWEKAYPKAFFKTINKENFLDFIKK